MSSPKLPSHFRCRVVVLRVFVPSWLKDQPAPSLRSSRGITGEKAEKYRGIFSTTRYKAGEKTGKNRYKVGQNRGKYGAKRGRIRGEYGANTGQFGGDKMAKNRIITIKNPETNPKTFLYSP